MEQVIQVKGLKKYFGKVRAVDDISFSVERGELFGFLGVNGAGKSTTINMLCTLFQPTAGEIRIGGNVLGREDEAIRHLIGVVYQNNCLDDRLTVRENLLIRGSLYEKDSRKLKGNIERVCGRLRLEETLDRHFGRLSGGQKRKCEIARALLHTPEILFLDEPTTGLDPATRKTVWESLENLRQEGMTIFLTTHYMEEAARCSHIAVMDSGKIREYGTPFSLKEKYSRDRLRLMARPGMGAALEERLERWRRNLSGQDREKRLYDIFLQDSMMAIPVLKETEELLEGFELVQGSMDDVFLNITGKNLEEA
ncbi:MAG: ABC transporter ATP-binding protein [Eubacterium sp.]|nr:ABC transporter ATP-binding protein [Eubacterium sp.]MCM1216751.1 ABC transporter ATP-binding protein [Lachnospiraceae bacterium]MCM1303101.1 ABC transporter ATP-binding protein [Butyrivibrio sp.]MCM1343422.1 ABC transporter ATP-binding protein [Muribaculaceae bacterium]MCM1238799.1 ABC transporter ATP-binding protein [Lachnospiraceae bacterium]